MRASFFSKLKKSFLFVAVIVLSFSTLANLISSSFEPVYAIDSASLNAKPKSSERCKDDEENCRTVRICTVNAGCYDKKFTSVSTDEYTVEIKGDDEPITEYTVTVKAGSNTQEVRIPAGDFGSKVTVQVEDKDRNVIQNKDYSGATQAGGETLGGSGSGGENGGTTGDAEVTATCSSAAGGLGWITCVVLDALASLIQWLYETVIEPSLILSPTILTGTTGSITDSGTYVAWGRFRDIANILFVIFLLFIIFSQLTGVGIDNYGIKKSLPKLIAAAILVNLSFIICQLAVDVSNIVGASIYNFLTGFNITVPTTIDGVDILSGAGSIFITAGVAAAIGAGTIWAMTGFSGAAVGATALGLLTSLLAVIAGAAIGLLFLFFLLGMRQAIVVIFVVLSPLAFICYMLPNTKNLFDKWLNIFKAMLILYPICGLCIGGGYLASRILLASGGANDNFFILITAMIAEIGPYFLIPSLTRSAYAATGKLSGSLGKLSARFSGGASGLVRNSQWAQRRMKNAEVAQGTVRNERAARAAQRTADRMKSLKQNKGSLSTVETAMLAAANAEVDKQNEREGQLRYLSSETFLERRDQGRADAERRKQEEDAMALITSSDEYAHGTDINKMKHNLAALLNKNPNDVTEDERIQRGALVRLMAKTKGADKMLNDMVYDGSLSDTGLTALNEQRLQNSDVAATMAKKGAVTTLYLNAVASGAEAEDPNDIDPMTGRPRKVRVTADMRDSDAGRAQIGRMFASQALSDDADLATQSGSELKRFVGNLDNERIANFVQSPSYQQIVTDADKRSAIEAHPGYQQSIQQAARNEAGAQMREEAIARQNETFRVHKQEAHDRGKGVANEVKDADGNVVETNVETKYSIPVASGLFTGRNGTWHRDPQTNDLIYTENDHTFNANTGDVNAVPQGPPRPPAGTP